MVIDGATDSVVATVAAGGNVQALCYNPTDDKVYCSDAGIPYSIVTVIDGAGDSVVAAMEVAERARAMCYNSLNNKVYCVGYVTVTVIDVTGEAAGTVYFEALVRNFR